MFVEAKKSICVKDISCVSKIVAENAWELNPYIGNLKKGFLFPTITHWEFHSEETFFLMSFPYKERFLMPRHKIYIM